MNKHEKIARIFLIIFGGILTLCATYTILSGLISSLIHQPSHYKILTFVFIPILFLLGIAYLLLGIFLRKIKNTKFRIQIIISIFSVLWIIMYYFFHKSFSIQLNPGDSAYDQIDTQIFNIVGVIVPVISLLVPQLFVGFQLYKAEPKHTEDEQE